MSRIKDSKVQGSKEQAPPVRSPSPAGLRAEVDELIILKVVALKIVCKEEDSNQVLRGSGFSLDGVASAELLSSASFLRS